MSALKFAAVGAAAAEVVYVEDVFSTYLYTGNGTSQTVTNRIDLSTKGGLIWIKNRTTALNHVLVDTARGVNRTLSSNTTGAEIIEGCVTAFNTNGFVVDDLTRVNASGANIASWTFRKQPKFFDVVTYTGNGVEPRLISHSLGSVPGMIIIKRTNSATAWPVYHRSLGANKYVNLNTTAQSDNGDFYNAVPTSTNFSVSNNATVNASGGTYVAYIFAHDAGGFGLTGTDNVISCGSYIGAYPSDVNVTLGYEPQLILVKNAMQASDWFIYDVMRGMSYSDPDYSLAPNSSVAENGASGAAISFNPTSTGFIVNSGLTAANVNGSTHIYIAIRRGPMKVPTTGTSVFSPALGSGTAPGYVSGFPVDLGIERNKGSAANTEAGSRLTGARVLQINSTAVEADSTNTKFDYMNGFFAGTKGTNEIAWMFRRAPGFFDVVCYKGTGVAMTVPHNLTVAPEFILLKERQPNGYPWLEASNFTATTYQYALPLSGSTDNSTSAAYGTMISAKPTASVLNLGAQVYVNSSASTYIAYLFATCAGVSKVGTYIGNGTLQTINCGFTAGARFILIKRPVTGGAVFVWDSARGIVAGNDPYLNLSTTAAEVTTDDSVDTDSSGFIVNQLAATNINVSAASYIFLAIS